MAAVDPQKVLDHITAIKRRRPAVFGAMPEPEAPPERRKGCGDCGGKGGKGVPLQQLRAREAMCWSCPMRRWCGRTALEACPERRWPDAAGVIRWGLEPFHLWYGVPAPIRWGTALHGAWRAMRERRGFFAGCGCSKPLKDAWVWAWGRVRGIRVPGRGRG